MRYTVAIDTENDAFAGCEEDHVADILCDVVGYLRRNVMRPDEKLPLYDGNGNTIGYLTTTDGE